MMADEERTAGTPDPNGGDAAESTQTTGTQGTDDRNAEATSGINRDEALAWKAKAERCNQLEAENAELKRLQQSPAATGNDRRDPIGDALQQTREFAEKGDPVAIMNLALLEALKQQDTNRRLDAVPEAKRKAVEEHFNKNRHRFADIDGARAEVERNELATENENLRKELARSVGSKPDPDVVRTSEREVPASERKTEVMTRARWDREQAEFERRANAGDIAASKERMRQQMARRNGKIQVKD